MVRGKMCVSVGRERVTCRIDPAIHDAVLERQGCHTVVMRGHRGNNHAYRVGKSLEEEELRMS
jgi:hypothetical protein